MPLSNMPLNELVTKIPTPILLNELNRRNPWLDRNQAGPIIGVEPETLAARDSRKSHKLRKFKDGPNGRVKYKWLDLQEYVERQTDPG